MASTLAASLAGLGGLTVWLGSVLLIFDMKKTSAQSPGRRSWHPRTNRAGGLFSIAALMALPPLGDAAEPFKKLTAGQIRAAIIGKDFTDDVHWAIQHFRDGTVKSYHMGTADAGRWRLDGDAICVDYVKDGKECHEVWRSGGTLQLRRVESGSMLEGVVVAHRKRD